MCRDNTFRLLLKMLLKELFTNKGEILSCKSVKPCKSRKNRQEYCTRTRDKSGSNSLPFQGNVQIPPSPGTMHSQLPRVWPGGGGWMFKLQFDLYISCLGTGFILEFGPWGGGVLPYMAYTGGAAGQGMVFGLSILNRVCDFVRVGPKQGM